jgi:biotin carboxyl carrier protein
MTIVPAGGDRYHIVDGTRRRSAYAVRGRNETWVFFEGRVYVVATVRPPAHGARHAGTLDDEAALSAPMPATVVSVNVAAGQRVARGDLLVTLEAMKMELAVRAPRDGTIGRIISQPGELVQPGVPLVELE